MTPSLPWFKAKLTIHGFSSNDSSAVVTELAGLLRLRDDLRKVSVAWTEADGSVIVELDTQGTNSRQAGNQISEELLEFASILGVPIGQIDVIVASVEEL